MVFTQNLSDAKREIDMLITPWGDRPEPDAGDSQFETPQSRVRRGATALEYLVCLSTIIVVVILTIQHLGSTVSNTFANNAKATSGTVEPAAPAP